MHRSTINLFRMQDPPLEIFTFGMLGGHNVVGIGMKLPYKPNFPSGFEGRFTEYETKGSTLYRP